MHESLAHELGANFCWRRRSAGLANWLWAVGKATGRFLACCTFLPSVGPGRRRSWRVGTERSLVSLSLVGWQRRDLHHIIAGMGSNRTLPHCGWKDGVLQCESFLGLDATNKVNTARRGKQNVDVPNGIKRKRPGVNEVRQCVEKAPRRRKHSTNQANYGGNPSSQVPRLPPVALVLH